MDGKDYVELLFDIFKIIQQLSYSFKIFNFIIGFNDYLTLLNHINLKKIFDVYQSSCVLLSAKVLNFEKIRLIFEAGQ